MLCAYVWWGEGISFLWRSEDSFGIDHYPVDFRNPTLVHRFCGRSHLTGLTIALLFFPNSFNFCQLISTVLKILFLLDTHE